MSRLYVEEFIHMPSPKQSVFGDLQDSRLIWAKGILFLVLGCLAAVALIARMPSVTECALLGITVWAFCRAYYFAFYVIEHYVDPSFRFAGLFAFLQYAMKRRRQNLTRRNDPSGEV